MNEQHAPTDVSPPAKAVEIPSWTVRIAPHVDVANKAVQIVAIIVAGLWAYWTWQQTFAPGLGTGLLVTAEVKAPWSELDKACTAQVFVSVENVGTRNVEVARTKYDIFKAPRPTLSGNEKFKLMQYPPAGTESLSSGELAPRSTLAHVYPPKAKSSQSLDFLLSPDETNDIFFSVELLDRDGSRLGDQYGEFETCQRPAEAVPPK